MQGHLKKDGDLKKMTALKGGDPNGIRTRVTPVKGGCPRPLDDRVVRGAGYLSPKKKEVQSNILKEPKNDFLD